jgi:hypothetical protein
MFLGPDQIASNNSGEWMIMANQLSPVAVMQLPEAFNTERASLP